jgi:tetratricopeptide (TPR) repeat protein
MKKSSTEENQLFFLDTWKLVQSNLRKFQYRLKQHPFSITEKKILTSFYLYNKNKKEEALDLLKIKIQDDSFHEGMRYYLKGLIYNQHGHFSHAIENLNNSVECFKKQKESPFIINSLCLLVNVYSNRRDIQKTSEVLDQLIVVEPQNDSQKLQKQYAQMCYYSITGQTKNAVSFYKKIKDQSNPQFEIYRPYFLVNLFNLHATDKKFDQCFIVLDEYKKISGCLVKANYLYMKCVLEHLTQDAPLYFYSKDFKDFPELYMQLKVINLLKSGDTQEAAKVWSTLSHHNKFLYDKNFTYTGEKSLFYQALQKHLVNSGESSIDEEKLESIKTNLEKMAYIFSVCRAPIQNEELIRLIWNEELTEISLQRLRKLVSDYSKKYNAKVKAFDARYKVVS